MLVPLTRQTEITFEDASEQENATVSAEEQCVPAADAYADTKKRNAAARIWTLAAEFSRTVRVGLDE